jgi:hypothetical protein
MSDENYTENIVDYVTYGIDENIDAEDTIEVSLRDLVFVSQTLQEFIQFFHNIDHYPTLEEVNKYLGTKNSNGAYDLFSKANYEVMPRMLPDKVRKLYENGAFDNPEKPFYFAP